MNKQPVNVKAKSIVTTSSPKIKAKYLKNLKNAIAKAKTLDTKLMLTILSIT